MPVADASSKLVISRRLYLAMREASMRSSFEGERVGIVMKAHCKEIVVAKQIR